MRLLIWILIFLLTTSSCKKESGLEHIEIKEVFAQHNDKYLVCFYSTTCKACEDTIELLNRRYEIKKYRAFLVKTDDLDTNFVLDKTSNIGIRNTNESRIYVVPYLIFINRGVIEKELFGYKEIHKENLYIFFEWK